MKINIINIYELLGLVKDGKAPKKIKYSGIEYEFNGKDYINEFGVNLLQHVTYAEYIMTHKVEILEEEKKIPEKIEYYDDSIAWVIDDVGQLSDADKVIIDTLNGVIDYLNSYEFEVDGEKILLVYPTMGAAGCVCDTELLIASGINKIVALSPIPPVACLSTIFSAISLKSIISPDSAIATLKYNISSAVNPFT